MMGKVLLAGEDLVALEPLQRALAERGFECRRSDSVREVLAAAARGEIDVVLAQPSLSAGPGEDLRTLLAAAGADVQVVVLPSVALADPGSARELDALELGLHRAVRRRARRGRDAEAEAGADAAGGAAEPHGFDALLGSSAPMQQLYELIARAARTAASVLITGESGTGKELVARALHQRSRRAEGPFVALNCSAIPENLLESELFGHVKGAFTDAKSTRAGLLLNASGGTIFLDEIGDMPMALQPKLLRALQERTMRPLGSDHEQTFDVRVVAATNQDLERAVQAKRFREDLYYRLNVIHVSLPPLRARIGDVLVLAQHFVESFAVQMDKDLSGLSASAAEALLSYAWPGNVRELQNCIEHAVAMTGSRELQRADLPEKLRHARPAPALALALAEAEPAGELVSMDEVERRYIARVLHAVGGNKREAARILGFDRKTLYRKLERYGERAETGGERGDEA
ncbi:sigma-54-dependent transcriptional regulator [Haliangium ochraceum]|uniref:Sigma54 specific transcriptional regulator, Fis family n=1 Tax=Haliangium ochraceum (strain DSM 14365 / JCM 11303 / SMP-2) TaxID=502025 RepID=D0LVH8_HALO1|nr:sigma-54 dependent transcriptional regulator [Haliangium ochraceum]ACY17539.1 sigma54 specific transcriptional regulator, Fis family [Haliangium ochraceum DSM 14365]